MHVENAHSVVPVIDSKALCPDWIYEAVSASQRVINRLALRRAIEPADFAEFESLRPAETRVEELVLHGLLFEIALRLRRECGADLTTQALSAIKDRSAQIPRRHRREAVTRAARLIDARYAEPLNVPRLASELGSREATLRAAFTKRFGLSMRDYHKRARVRAAGMLFAGGHVDVLSVARLVGYRSEKNFYAAVRQITGGTAAELRATAIGGARSVPRPHA